MLVDNALVAVVKTELGWYRQRQLHDAAPGLDSDMIIVISAAFAVQSILGMIDNLRCDHL